MEPVSESGKFKTIEFNQQNQIEEPRKKEEAAKEKKDAIITPLKPAWKLVQLIKMNLKTVISTDETTTTTTTSTTIEQVIRINATFFSSAKLIQFKSRNTKFN